MSPKSTSIPRSIERRTLEHDHGFAVMTVQMPALSIVVDQPMPVTESISCETRYMVNDREGTEGLAAEAEARTISTDSALPVEPAQRDSRSTVRAEQRCPGERSLRVRSSLDSCP